MWTVRAVLAGLRAWMDVVPSSSSKAVTVAVHGRVEHVSRPAPQKVVLEEDAYVGAVDAIIKRDFFPDLLPDNAPVPDARLNEFVATHTSEDNASFNDIIDRQNAALREGTRWMDAKSDGVRRAADLRDRLQLPAAHDDDDPRPKCLEFGAYQPQNALMFNASTEHPHVIVDRGDRVAPENTRLRESCSSSMSDATSATIDSGVQDGSATPTIRGYKPVRAPVYEPDKVPITTWGRVAGTPVQLDDGDQEQAAVRGFRVPDAPDRERIARRLGQAAAKSIAKRQRDRSWTPSPRLTRTPSTPRAVQMSPAARRLLSKRQKSRGAGDPELRASYSGTPVRDPYDEFTPGPAGRRSPSARSSTR